MYSQFTNHLLDAAEFVMAWDDLPAEDFAEAVKFQACLMAGINPDELLWHYAD